MSNDLSTKTQKLGCSKNGGLNWLRTLLQITRLPKGETTEQIEAQLSIYLEALELFQDQMTKATLLECATKFSFFPSIADLNAFFEERQGMCARPRDRTGGLDEQAWLALDPAKAWWQDHDTKTGLPLTRAASAPKGLGNWKPLFTSTAVSSADD